MPRRSRAKPPSSFKGVNSSPEVIRLVVLMYVRFASDGHLVSRKIYKKQRHSAGAEWRALAS